MKNQNTVFITIVSALAFALAPVTKAGQKPDGGPDPVPASAPSVVTVHSIDNVTRGRIGSFVLDMKPALMLGGKYVNFKVSGTAIAGVDYVLLVSPAYIGQSGYGVMQVKTLRDPRGSAFLQALSVIVTLEAGPGYAVGEVGQPQCGLNLRLSRQTTKRCTNRALRCPREPLGQRGFASGAVPGDESTVSPFQLFNASTVSRFNLAK